MLEPSLTVAPPRPASPAPLPEVVSPDARAVPWPDLAFVGALALALRLAHLDHSPHYDEFFHVLGARALLERGSMCIADCLHPYTRGALFTYLVAASYKLFGIGLVAARLPSVLAGTLWVVAVHRWTGRTGGRAAGLAAGLLLALDPGALYLSQISRFYALQALLFWLAATGLYLLAVERRTTRATVGLALGVAAALLVSLHLQVTTLIGLVGVGLWLALVHRARLAALLRRPAGRVGTVAIALVGLAGLAAAWRVGILGALWRTYRWSSLWLAGQSDNPKYFFDYFLEQYGWLWSLAPLAAVVAYRRAPRPAGFCLVVFAGIFLLHSFSGFKEFRVVYYGVPFFLALWGLAIGGLAPALWTTTREAVGRLLPAAGATTRHAVAALLLIGAAGYLALTTESVSLTRMMATVSDLRWPKGTRGYRGFAIWAPATPALRPIADSVQLVVTSAANKSIWYLGRADAAISENQMYDGHGALAPEFTRDWQAGVPLVSRPASVAALLACYPSGLIVAEPGHWNRHGGVPPETAALIERYTQPVAVPSGSDLLAFRWDRPVPISGISCSPAPLTRGAGAPPAGE